MVIMAHYHSLYGFGCSVALLSDGRKPIFFKQFYWIKRNSLGLLKMNKSNLSNFYVFRLAIIATRLVIEIYQSKHWHPNDLELSDAVCKQWLNQILIFMFHALNRYQNRIKAQFWKKVKCKSTVRATDTWVSLFKDYLFENDLPEIDDIATEDLPKILCNFYPSCKNLRKSKPQKNPEATFTDQNDKDEGEEDYHNSTMKCTRTALNRYFRAKRGIDITSNESFIPANEMFKALQKKGKKEGRGEVENKKPISDEDYKLISDYFKVNMRQNANPKNLQEIVLFNIIYYMGHRGRENLRLMTKETFKIKCDNDGRRYIYQAVKESDKNHKEMDLQASNEATIYEVRGNVSIFSNKGLDLQLSATSFRNSV